MVLDIHDLSISLHGHEIIRHVDLRIAQGERVGLIGTSGSGKSMLARTMLGIEPVDAQVSGEMTLAGTSLVGLDEREYAQLRGSVVTMIFQNAGSALNPTATIRQHLMLPLTLHYDLSPQQLEERVTQMMHRIELPVELLDRYPHELSGGQQQRVSIAMALITSPQLIIADEPTTALDSITSRKIVDLLVSLVDEMGSSLLFITHDFSVLAHAVNQCAVIDNGEIVENAPIQQLMDHPQHERTRQLVEAANELTLHATSTDMRKDDAHE